MSASSSVDTTDSQLQAALDAYDAATSEPTPPKPVTQRAGTMLGAGGGAALGFIVAGPLGLLVGAIAGTLLGGKLASPPAPVVTTAG